MDHYTIKLANLGGTGLGLSGEHLGLENRAESLNGRTLALNSEGLAVWVAPITDLSHQIK